QKIVVKVSMPCERSRSKAMTLAARADGVISMAITGDGKDKLEVVGDGVDPVRLVSCLRRKVGSAEILQVEEVKDKKPEEEKKKPEEPKPQLPMVVHPPPHGYPYPGGYYYPPPPPMQRIVIKAQMTCEKCRKSAMALAGSTCGVQSVEIVGDDRDQLVVVGDGVDATSLTKCLRKVVKVGRADIIKMEDAVDKKAAAKPADEAPAGNPVAEWPPQGYYTNPHHPGHGYYCPRTGVFYPYTAGYQVEDYDEAGSLCTIM
ncbi:hypothetical protein BAE44_0003878, partial [Dichanthelium oligosanthes]